MITTNSIGSNKLLEQFKLEKSMDDQKLNKLVKDLPCPLLSGPTVGDVLKLGITDGGNPMATIRVDPNASGGIWSSSGDYGYAAVNAIGDLLLLQLYAFLELGYHRKMVDFSSPIDLRNVLYTRTGPDNAWVAYRWYAYGFVESPYKDEKHAARTNALHSEMDVIIHCLRAGIPWSVVFPGSNGPRYKRRIEEVLNMTLAEARQLKEKDFALASVAGDLQSATGKVQAFDITKPVIVEGVDLRTKLPFVAKVTKDGFTWERNFSEPEDLIWFEANLDLIKAGVVTVEIS